MALRVAFISLGHAPLAWEIDRLKQPATRGYGEAKNLPPPEQVADLARQTGRLVRQCAPEACCTDGRDRDDAP